jgi:DNA polymerase-3 subunit epsilon
MSSSIAHGSVAVLDVETTGLHPKGGNRIVEIAIVVIGSNGVVEKEFVSLVNPNRDVGPTKIHNIYASDIINAPKFEDIAGHILEALQGCVAIVGHNVRFDKGFLRHEFERIEVELPEYFSLCTMYLSGGGKLFDCCERFGVDVGDVQHEALVDARFTAKLFTLSLPGNEEELDELLSSKPIDWPTVTKTNAVLLTRQEAEFKKSEPPPYLEKLLKRTHENASDLKFTEAQINYIDMLDRALEDRIVDEAEAKALFETAIEWGLSGKQILDIHENYLIKIVTIAMEDGIISDFEMQDLLMVATLLGKKEVDVINIINKNKVSPMKKDNLPSKSIEDFKGKKVCFTGELFCSIDGVPISRKKAQELSIEAGLEVLERVTKELEILVVADPNTLSGKAKKAKIYGVRILHENVFWKTLGIKVD